MLLNNGSVLVVGPPNELIRGFTYRFFRCAESILRPCCRDKSVATISGGQVCHPVCYPQSIPRHMKQRLVFQRRDRWDDEPDETLEGLGDRLKWALLQRFGTLHGTSVEMDVQVRSLQRYVAGRSLPGAEMLRRFYLAGISTDWLVNASGCAFWQKDATSEANACCGGLKTCPHGLPRKRGSR